MEETCLGTPRGLSTSVLMKVHAISHKPYQQLLLKFPSIQIDTEGKAAV